MFEKKITRFVAQKKLYAKHFNNKTFQKSKESQLCFNSEYDSRINTSKSFGFFLSFQLSQMMIMFIADVLPFAEFLKI